jgi:hypothetical protein
LSFLYFQWVPWPEDHFSTPNDRDNTRDWTVFPLVHTFPAFEPSKMKWVASTCAQCPKTSNLLKLLPSLRTALFSKLGPGTKLSSHTGWADLANYVLRSHLCLQIPSDGSCGLIVNGEVSLRNCLISYFFTPYILSSCMFFRLLIMNRVKSLYLMTVNHIKPLIIQKKVNVWF